MKQISAVLDAVHQGGQTSTEIAEMTGLPLRHVSAFLSDLESDGVIFWTKYSRRHQRAGAQQGVLDQTGKVGE